MGIAFIRQVMGEVTASMFRASSRLEGQEHVTRRKSYEASFGSEYYT